MTQRRPNLTRYIAIALAIVAIPGALAVNAAIQDDEKPLIVNPGPSTTTTVPATTTSTPVNTQQQFVYPWDAKEGPSFKTPVALANSFARDFLGMTNPTVGTYRAGDSLSGEIDIFAFERGVATTVLVRQRGDGDWFVVASSSPNLQLDIPTTDDTIRSPVHLKGRSVAFEGTVQVTLLNWGYTMQCTLPTDTCGSGRAVLANTFFTGHGTDLTAFDFPLSFELKGEKTGVLLLWTASAMDGSMAEATVRLVRF